MQTCAGCWHFQTLGSSHPASLSMDHHVSHDAWHKASVTFEPERLPVRQRTLTVDYAVPFSQIHTPALLFSVRL
jgi:hypothetical protein